MALGDNQKSFYDTRRQFQGKDNPDVPAAPPLQKPGMDRGQVLAGLVFLAVIAIGFWFFGRPAPIETGAPAAPAPSPTAPAH